MHIGSALKIRDITPMALAGQTGIPVRAMRKIFRDERHVTKAEALAIANALGVPFGQLIGCKTTYDLNMLVSRLTEENRLIAEDNKALVKSNEELYEDNKALNDEAEDILKAVLAAAERQTGRIGRITRAFRVLRGAE